MVFGTTKPYLWQIRILYTARLQFKIRVTIYQPILYEKPQKSPFFRPVTLSLSAPPVFGGQISNIPLQIPIIPSPQFNCNEPCICNAQ